jgi:tRNA pseudouridine32 synthase/23S rRNA pseudouridine746 synthase
MISIIFQNEHLIAVDKPSGFLSVPSRMGVKDPRPVIGRMLQEQLGTQIYPIHRLDFEVSGILIFALTQRSHRDFNRAFEKRLISKKYQAFSTGGHFQVGDKGTWKCYMLKGKKRAYEKPFGDLAITDYEVLCIHHGSIFEWSLWPKTGRSHQLRFELFRHRSPILGDQLYGSNVKLQENQIALRATSLVFNRDLVNLYQIPSELMVTPFKLTSILSLQL